MKDVLTNYLNEAGHVSQWPAKYSRQRLVLKYLSDKFTADRTYTEQEVNSVLREWHTFEDWAMLRRALIDEGFMQRDLNGTEYKRCPIDT